MLSSSFYSSLQRIVEKAARRLLVWVLQIFFLNRLSVRVVDFSDYFTAREFILRILLFSVSVEASSDSRNLVMVRDVEVALVSSVDPGSHLLKKKAFYSHRKTQNFCQESFKTFDEINKRLILSEH